MSSSDCNCDNLIKAVDRTPCECEPLSYPFQCPRHPNCLKNEHFVHLCKTRIEYFQGWEIGTSPCFDSDERPTKLCLGDLVAWLLSKIGIIPWPGCGCQGRKAFLNRLCLPYLRRKRHA